MARNYDIWSWNDIDALVLNLNIDQRVWNSLTEIVLCLISLIFLVNNEKLSSFDLDVYYCEIKTINMDIGDSSSSSVIPVKVAVRVRPFDAREKDENAQQTLKCFVKQNQVLLNSNHLKYIIYSW